MRTHRLGGLRPASLALLSGALLALSFPRFGHPALAWIALAPLLTALAAGPRTCVPTHRGARRAFTLGLLTGIVFFVGTTYWIGAVMRQYGGLGPAVATLLMMTVAAYLALYPAAFALLVHRLVTRLGPRGLLLTPAVWVTVELGRTHLFTGFPWVLLGHSQASVLPVAQLASVLGVYGLSALVALANTAIAWAVLDRGRWRWSVAAAAAAAIATTVGWGGARLRDGSLTREGVPFRVGIVQGSVPQDQKWDRARAESILKTYLAMSREVAGRGARLIVWPESALPFYFEEDLVEGASIRRLAVETRSHLLFGGDQVERSTPARYYNSAFLVDPDGHVGGVYRKVHLVPFGEYVPFKRLLSFAGPLVEAVSDFSPGDRVVTMRVAGHPVSTAICYEVVYPDLASQATALGSQLLTTITNDAWFGRSSAPWQHFEMASLRAVEQGRYLVRSANTGISGIVDPYGRVLVRSGLFEPVALSGDIRFLTARTPYARSRDLFADACGVATLAALLVTMWRRVRS